jgi:hypothetical protein
MTRGQELLLVHADALLPLLLAPTTTTTTTVTALLTFLPFIRILFLLQAQSQTKVFIVFFIVGEQRIRSICPMDGLLCRKGEGVA